jgi:hypothetical protein
MTTINTHNWELLVGSREWKRLTAQQKVFVVDVIVNGGDSRTASRMAYPGANAHSQIVMAYQVSQSIRVWSALKFWRGLERSVKSEVVAA